MSGGPAPSKSGSIPLPPLTAGPHKRRLGLVAIIATFGGLLFGYDTGVTNGAESPMQVELGLSDAQIGFVVSALVFSAAFGAMTGGWLSDRIGRRPTIIILAIAFFTGTALVCLSPSSATFGEFSPVGYGVLIAGRILLGLAVGGASSVVPVYLAEMAPFEIRGSLAGRNEFMIVFGQFLAFLINAIIAGAVGYDAEHAYLHPGIWRFMFAVCAVPAIVLFFGMLRMPESPRWLLEKDREADALAVLKMIRSPERAEAELADVRRVAEEEAEMEARQVGFKAILENKNLLVILLIACGLGIAQQFTGVNTIMYYGQRVLTDAGMDPSIVKWANIAPGVMAVIGALIALTLMDRINRRTNFLWGWGLTALAHILIVVSMLFIFPEGNAARPWVFLVLEMFMILTIQTFLNIAVWVYLSEIFPLRMRGVGMGISVFVLWFANGVIALFAPILLGAIGMGMFVIFAVANVISFVFVKFKVPETRGRTLEELDEDVTTGAIRLPSARQ